MHQNIVDTLKEHYTRALRKEVVRNILKYEKGNDKKAQESSYKVINQIFTYIISELGWSISQNTNGWDDTPLRIISEVFPKIETTKWFKDQQLHVTKSINLESNFN